MLNTLSTSSLAALSLGLLLATTAPITGWADCTPADNLIGPHHRTTNVLGGLVYDTNTGTLKTCDGTNYHEVGGSGGGGSTATDRISTTSVASGSGLAMVATDGNVISFTTSGVNTAYLGSTGLFVGPGVSITTANGISSTNGYFSGNVGIGTTAPTSALQVSGTFTVSSTLTNANPALYVSSSGKVGIGTSAPSTLLHIRNTGASGKVFANNTGLIVENNGSSSGFYAMQVATAGANDAFVIRNDGAVGVGTSSPVGKFDVTELTNPSFPHSVRTTGRWSGHYLVAESYPRSAVGQNVTGQNLPYDGLFLNGNGTTTFDANGVAVSTPANRTLAFYTSDGAALTERLRIGSTGNVGIGTTAPSGTLSVSGTVAMTRYSAAPVACSAIYNGLMAMTSTARLCACDGTSWKYPDDTGAACSW
jgi:hypothetical protein